MKCANCKLRNADGAPLVRPNVQIHVKLVRTLAPPENALPFYLILTNDDGTVLEAKYGDTSTVVVAAWANMLGNIVNQNGYTYIIWSNGLAWQRN